MTKLEKGLTSHRGACHAWQWPYPAPWAPLRGCHALTTPGASLGVRWDGVQPHCTTNAAPHESVSTELYYSTTGPRVDCKTSAYSSESSMSLPELLVEESLRFPTSGMAM